MALIKNIHSDFESVTRELENLDKSKDESEVVATRAPNSGDKATRWLQYNASSDTTLTLWRRHPVTGTWRSVNLT